MRQTTETELIESLEAANNLFRLGIRFVPIPVSSDEEYYRLLNVTADKLLNLVKVMSPKDTIE